MSEQQDIWAQQAARAEARREIDFFRRQTDGEFNYLLACHAAVSEVLTPDLLYLLRDNFKRDIHGISLNIPWMAISDLLLSNLCREIGYDTFELQPTVRKVLYENLERDARFGKQRLLELSDFLMAYIRPLLMHQSPAQRREARRQRWVALSISHPELAAEEVAAEYQAYQEKGHRAGQGYIRRFLEKAPVRSAQLAVLERYVVGTNELARGHAEKGKKMLQGLGERLEFGDVRLEVPQTKPEEPLETAVPLPTPPLGKKKWEAPEPLIPEQLREAIYRLNINKELGLMHLTNVGRNIERDRFWDNFDKAEEKGIPFQFYFLPGDPRQMPQLFAERMAYELIVEELEDDLDAIFIPTRPDGRPKVNRLLIDRDLAISQSSFQRFMLETFNVQERYYSFEDFVTFGLHGLPYKFVVLPFYIDEREINNQTFAYLEWITQEAFPNKPGEETPTFLFFFIVSIEDRSAKNGQRLLSNLRNLTVKVEQNVMIEIFNPVLEKDLVNWLRDMGVLKLKVIEHLIRVFVEGLSKENQALYNTQSIFNMADIARLQEYIYQLHNQ